MFIEVRTYHSHEALSFGASETIFSAFDFAGVKMKDVVEVHIDEMKMIPKMRSKVDSKAS